MTRRSPLPEKPPGEHYSVPTDVPAGLIPIGEELSRLEETARFSAQGQFEAAKSWARWNFILGVPASVFGLFSGGAAFTEAFPVWVVGGGALIGAALAGIMTVIGAERRATRAKTCANTFHDIQDDARRLLLINLASLNADEGHAALTALCDRYSETRHAADAPARRFYNRAKKNITAGGQQFAIDAVKITAACTAPLPPGRGPSRPRPSLPTHPPTRRRRRTPSPDRRTTMAELASPFEKAQSNIEPSDQDWDNAPEAHKAIADFLGEDETLKKWGINPILIGSYGRRVSIRRVYDVDMFCRLVDYPEGVAADEVLDRVYEVLVDAYDEESVTREDRSVTVLVPDADGLYVDVVPAREVGSVWEIPTEGGEWIATNPVEMAELKEDKNADFDEMYVPCVKLLRQARRTLLGKTKPGGFAVEMAFFTACEEGLVTKTTSMTQFFASAMEGVADVFRRIADDGFEIPDPSMPGEVMDFDDDADFATAADKFESAATDARAAADTDEGEAGSAALLIRAILGPNDDFENVFPMPHGYDKHGNKKDSSNRTAGDRKPTPGPLRFG